MKLWRAMSIRPRPISTRPKSRGAAEARRNIRTPIRINAGAISATSNDSTCTIRVVPTLAPSITASAGTKSTRPSAAKPVTIRPVAVLLCTTAVTPIPARKAVRRLRKARPRKPRSLCAEDTLHAALDHVDAPQQQRHRAGELEQGDGEVHCPSPVPPEAPGNADNVTEVGSLAMLLQQVKPLPGVARWPPFPVTVA
jgi:hypothetical protein